MVVVAATAVVAASTPTAVLRENYIQHLPQW